MNNLQAGLNATCFPESNHVTNQTELAEWFGKLDELGQVVENIPYGPLAEMCNRCATVIATATYGDNDITAWEVTTRIIVATTASDDVQVIPAVEWQQWWAACPEWEELSGVCADCGRHDVLHEVEHHENGMQRVCPSCADMYGDEADV